MHRILLPILLLLQITAHSQNTIDWDEKHELQLSDFQSSATSIGSGSIYSLLTVAGPDFSFHMTNAEFMFTKNFNSKVTCTFKRNASVLVAPDSTTALDLLSFGQYEFDLAELSARKFRKKLYENKGAFSNVNFFQPIYNEIQNEYSVRHTNAGTATDLGRNHEKLRELHQEVLQEIELLSDFCKSCKPPKKKK